VDLILWRHAEAEDADARGDLERALTTRGRKQAERLGEWLRPRIPDAALVIASPARRAVQTAKGLDRAFEERAAIAPGASAASLLLEAGWPDRARTVIVVAHQPTLGEVAAHLLGGSSGLSVRKASIWWFVAREGGAVLRCVMDADLAAP
jgi:phosphohistidine phosphatase